MLLKEELSVDRILSRPEVSGLTEVSALAEVVALWVCFFAALAVSTEVFSLSLLLDSAFDTVAAVWGIVPVFYCAAVWVWTMFSAACTREVVASDVLSRFSWGSATSLLSASTSVVAPAPIDEDT